MVSEPKIYIALPVLDESNNIENLINCLQAQSYAGFELVVCVNQYDHWWEDEQKYHICVDNQRSLELFNYVDSFPLRVIDRSTQGKGWKKKKGGVGWARKTCMDDIKIIGSSNDIIVSIDADTYYPPQYLQKIKEYFHKNRKDVGLAIPYYHKLNNDVTDRLILRYEIYMRCYLLNMLSINNPYAYSALGSAMAFPIWAYKKVGGLTPVSSGEDFYFLQKLTKNGTVGNWVDTIAYPSSRFSNRVDFGTGPALIKGNNGDWDSYPVYSTAYFDEIKGTFELFNSLFDSDKQTPMDSFINEQFGNNNIWDPLRNNYKDVINFNKACCNKIDGLRILQFLKWKSRNSKSRDEDHIYELLTTRYGDELTNTYKLLVKKIDYISSEIETLNEVRNLLFDIEQKVRKTS